MIQKYFLTCLILLTAPFAISQTYQIKRSFTDAEKKQFLGKTNEFFNLDPQIAYNLSNKDAAVSFAEMSDEIKYDAEYLKKQQALLAKDSVNASALNNMGNYYTNTGNAVLAKKYFTQSLKHLALGTKKDSASYYSFRATLKSNLQMDGAIDDIEKALRINPNDSLATTFYPMFLFQQGKIPELKKACANALEAKGIFPELPYLYYILGSLLEKYEFAFTGADNPELKKKYLRTDYDVIIDYTEIDRYAALYKDKTIIQNMRKLSEAMAMMLKIYVFEKSKDNWFIPAFTPTEKVKMQALETWINSAVAKKTLNPYGAYKTIGFIHFLLDNKIKSVDYYNKAVAVFPTAKKSAQFNTEECRDLLISLYRLQKDQPSLKKTIADKITTAQGGPQSAFDHMLMAKFYLLDNKPDEATAWAKKAKEIEPKNFEVIRLLSHLSFIDGRQPMCKYYAEEASGYIRNNTDYYNLDMQFAIYHILNGDANAAVENIRVAHELRAKDNEQCPLCDELMATYVVAK